MATLNCEQLRDCNLARPWNQTVTDPQLFALLLRYFRILDERSATAGATVSATFDTLPICWIVYPLLQFLSSVYGAKMVVKLFQFKKCIGSTFSLCNVYTSDNRFSARWNLSLKLRILAYLDSSWSSRAGDSFASPFPSVSWYGAHSAQMVRINSSTSISINFPRLFAWQDLFFILRSPITVRKSAQLALIISARFSDLISMSFGFLSK